jgi:hypothetical protein
MSAAGGWMEAVRRLGARLRPHHRHPRLVRRTHIHCPHSGALVEVEIELGSGRPERRILRCRAHPERPPPCDQRCRFAPEAFVGPADALIILPEGCEDTEGQD